MRLSLILTDEFQKQKLPGPGNIHLKLLKEAADTLAMPLTLLFRQAVHEGTVSEDQKNTLTWAIHKKGNILSPSKSNFNCWKSVGNFL